MLIGKASLQQLLHKVLEQRVSQGAELDAAFFSRRIDAASASYDELYELALELRSPALRADWPYIEPIHWDDIVECSPGLQAAPSRSVIGSHSNEKIQAAFLGSVCGCMLGKPLEVNPSLRELERAGTDCGEWPLAYYVSNAFLESLGRQHDSAAATSRENLRVAVADDDLHYSLLGMLLLEAHGSSFGHEQVYQLWGMNIAPLWAWGAERSVLLARAMEQHHVIDPRPFAECNDVLMLNPGDESCGALIRADAYGYACPGNPDMAAWLAYKDASFTHTRTGVYGAMFVAALIALFHQGDAASSADDRLDMVQSALGKVPVRSRFANVVRDCLDKVAQADNWQDGYGRIHGRYRQYSHCQVFQEIGTLINTLKFAHSIDHGICIQVSQGNDTDSFGATAGSILGSLFGLDYLPDRWLRPLGDRLEHGLSNFSEYSLSGLAERMASLPQRIDQEPA